MLDGTNVVPRVLNKRSWSEVTASTYVGRPTVWGNPFVIGRDGTRAEVVERYREHLLRRPDLLRRLPELRGKDLACWCAPLACHAEVLLELANA